jgi:hypothetical protein
VVKEASIAKVADQLKACSQPQMKQAAE